MIRLVENEAMPVAGGFWAVILYRPVQERRWASDAVLPKADGRGRGMCLNRQNSMVPETDSLDHRAGACYLPCVILYDELRDAVHVHSLSVPPSAF